MEIAQAASISGQWGKAGLQSRVQPPHNLLGKNRVPASDHGQTDVGDILKFTGAPSERCTRGILTILSIGDARSVPILNVSRTKQAASAAIPHRLGVGIEEAVAVLVLRSPLDADRPNKTTTVRWCASVRAARPGGRGIVRLEFHVHPRTSSPPGKDDTVQQGHAAGDAVSPALDERRERVRSDLDLIDCLQCRDRSGDGGRCDARRARGGEGSTGGAYFGIENLSDKIPVVQITSDEALEEGPAWDGREGRKPSGWPLREGDFDGPAMSIL
jgi:hypothetical protein